ncbi:collagen alpha-1(XII) chain-like [Branchiostoma floridae x Branchiostoma japonicum]
MSATGDAPTEVAELIIQEVAPMVVDIRWDHMHLDNVKKYTLNYTPLANENAKREEKSIPPSDTAATVDQLVPDTEYLFDLSAVGTDDQVHHVASKKFTTGPAQGTTDVTGTSDTNCESTKSDVAEKGCPDVKSIVQEIEERGSHSQGNGSYGTREQKGASKDKGTSQKMKENDVPGPVCLKAVAVGKTRIDVSWQAGYVAGSHYKVTYSCVKKGLVYNSVSTKEKTVTRPGAHCTILDSLDPNKEYTVCLYRVKGRTQTILCKQTVTTGHTIPSPESLSARPRDCTTLEASWTRPAQIPEEHVNAYLVSCVPASSKDQWQRIGSTNYVFKNLDGGTEHSIKVKCVCVDESVSEPVDTTAYTKPSPVKPYRPECSHSSIRLNWEYGPGNTKSVEVTLVSDYATQKIFGPKNLTKKHTTVLFEGLSPGTTYRYEIKTVSGDQENVSEGHVTTMLCSPGNLKAEQQGANAIGLSWSPPTNMDKVSGYIVTYSVKGASESEQTKEICPAGVRRCQVTDLLDDTEYDVSIRSFGGTKDSPLESASISVDPRPKTEVASVNNPEVGKYTHGSIEVKWEKRSQPWFWRKSQNRDLRVSICKVSDPNSYNSSKVLDDSKVTRYPFLALQPSTEYEISFDVVGSSSNKRTTIKQWTRPLPVNQFEVVQTTTERIECKWVRPSCRVDGYLISITAVGDSSEPKEVPLSVDDTTYLFESLDPGQQHIILIQSVLKVGADIIPSRPTQWEVTTTPMVPRNVRVENVMDESVLVKWDQPVRGKVDRYRVDLSSQNRTLLCKDIHELTYKFSQLQPLTKFDITVYSVRGEDLSEPTESVPCITKPSAVKSLRVEAASYDELTVVWDPSCDQAEYQVKIEPEEGKMNDRNPADPSASFSGLASGKAYTVTVVTKVGEDLSKPARKCCWTQVKPVDKIYINERDVTTSSMHVSWDKPEGVVEDYLVVIFPKHCREHTVNIKPDYGLSHSFHGLQTGVQYKITVQARSGNSTSAPKDKFQHTKVEKVREVRIAAVDEYSVTIFWVSPQGNVDNYYLKATQNQDDTEGIQSELKAAETFMTPTTRHPEEKKVPGTVTRHVFRELCPGASYTVAVQAESGPFKSALVCTTVSTKPAAIGKVEVTGVTENTIALKWDRAEGVNDSYAIDVRKDGRLVTKQIVPASDKLEYTIASLHPGRTYDIEIRTMNGRTAGSRPFELSKSTKPLPPTPSGLSVKFNEHVQRGCFLVSWPPLGRNSDVDKYCVQISPTWAVDTASKEVRASDPLAVQFEDPMQGPEYSVTVFSVSGDQQSEPVTKKYQLPLSKPTNVKATPTDTSIKVQWDSIRLGDNRYSYHLSVVQRHEGSSQVNVAEEGESSTKDDKAQGGADIQTSNEIVGLDASEASSVVHVTVPNSRNHRLSHTFDGLTPGVEYEVKVKSLSLKVPPEDASESKSAAIGPSEAAISHYESQPCCKFVRTKPTAPEDIVINACDVRPTSIPISWPEAKGKVEKYEVSISDANTKHCIQTKSVTKTEGQALSHTFENLVAGGQYIVEVKSVNKGDKSDPKRMTQQTPPLPPTNLKVDYNKRYKTIRITWKAPQGERDVYLIQAEPHTDDDMPIKVEKNKTSCTIPNAVPGEKYTIAVWTRRGDLSSERSTEPFQVPVSQAKNVQTKDVDDKTIKVTWEESEGKKTGYHVCIDSKDGANKEQENKTGDLTHCFTELVPGRLYTISVITLCGEVESESVEIMQRTKISPVAEITTDGGVTETSIRLRWSKPEGDQDKYRVAIYRSSVEGHRDKRVGDPHEFSSSNSDLEHKFHNLRPGCLYILTVESGCGGDWSEETTKLQRTTVSPVSYLQVSNITCVSFKLSWIHAVGDKDGYHIRVTPKLEEEQKDSWKTIPIQADKNEYVLEELTPGKEYTVDVITVSGDKESVPVPRTQRTVVAPVTELRARSSKEGQLELVWTEAEGDKDGYVCKIVSHSQCPSQSIPKDKNDWVLTGLVPGEMCEITLITVSGGVKSDEEPNCCQRVMPCAPKIHAKSTSTLDTLTVTWEDSVKDCVKECYEVKLHPARDPQALITDRTTRNDYQFTGLLPGTEYQVSVRSVSAELRSKEDLQIVTTEVSEPVIRNIKAEENKIEVELDESKGSVERYIWTRQESDNNSLGQEISVNVSDVLSSNTDVVTPLQKTVQRRGPSHNNLPDKDVEANGTCGNNRLCPRHVLFPKLKPCKQYFITVHAESAGKKSDHVQIYQHTRPHRPRKPECGNEGMNNFSVFWSPPLTEEERGRIVGYRVKFRRLANNLSTIEEVGEDDWKWLDPGNTTQQKIDETNADNTDYEIGIVSVAEIESHKPEDEGRKIKIESEPVRFRYRTMSYGKKFLQNAVLILITVFFLIAVIIAAVLLAGVYIDKCGNVDPGRDLSFNFKIKNNVTSAPVTRQPSTTNCLFEKAGTEFWIFILSLIVLTIDVVVLIIWYQVVRKRFARGRMQLLDDETIDEEEEETSFVQTVLQRTSRLLAYLRNMCAETNNSTDEHARTEENPSDRRPSESTTDSESDIWDESPIPSSFKRKRVTTLHSNDEANTGEGTSPKALHFSEESDGISTDGVQNDQELFAPQNDIVNDSLGQNPTTARESPFEYSNIVTVATVEEDEDWEDDYMSPLTHRVTVMDSEPSGESALQEDTDPVTSFSFLRRIGKKWQNFFKARPSMQAENESKDENTNGGTFGEDDEIENIEESCSVQVDERTPLLQTPGQSKK